MTVHPEAVTLHYQTYARVEPLALVRITPAETGVVANLHVLPGDRVEAGQSLASLTGPEVAARAVECEAAVRSARIALAGAQTDLAIQRRQLTSHLGTRQVVLQARASEARAQAALAISLARQKAFRQALSLDAPVSGVVVALDASNGERLEAGHALLTLQPSMRLWLRAVYFGNDASAIRVGMAGKFTPAGGGAAISVRVRTLFGALNPGGGQTVGLEASAPSPVWMSGEAGSVTLDGASQPMIAVPTQSLILDRGRWWLVVHTDNGDRPVAVVPGPARGWKTFIASGLKSGAQVLVDNAYLEFHRGISRNYQPPD